MSEGTIVPELAGKPRPWLTFFLSFLTPGLGHLYAGHPLHALLAFSAWAVAASIIVWLFFHPFGSVEIGFVALLMPFAVLGVPIHAAVAGAGRPIAVNRWFRLAICVAFLAASSQAVTRSLGWFRSNVAQEFRVPAVGMVPTLIPGDNFVVDKRAYRHASPERGDVVVFWMARDEVPAEARPERSRALFVKRVVAVPGDRVRVNGDTVILNGAQLPASRVGSTADQLEIWSESSADHSYTIARDPSRISSDSPEIVVPADRFFVLGDNRDHSTDSRHWGPVPATDIIGEVSHVYFSRDSATGELAWGRMGLRIE